MAITRLEIGRYKRLAIRSGDVWQGGLVRLPMWVDDANGAAIWIAARDRAPRGRRGAAKRRPR